jgi:molecular chaperone HscB
MNYFELFDMPVTPVVDKRDLSKKYFELQKKNHPDYYSQSTEEEKIEMQELSALINKAYKTFSNDQLTISYFLKLKGLLEEEEKYKLPDAFLMEMMDWNEELMEMSRDDAERRVGEYESRLFAEIKPLLDQYSDNTSMDDLLKIKMYYYKKKYLQRILDRMDD